MKKLQVSSYFLKVFLGYAGITILLAGLIFLATSRIIRDNYITSMQIRLVDINSSLKPEVLSAIESGNLSSVNGELRSLSREVSVRFTLIAPDGRVISDSDADPSGMDNHRYRQEVGQALEGKNGFAIRHSTTEKKDMLYTAIPLEKGGKIVAVLRSSMFLSDIRKVQNDFIAKIARITVFILVLGLFIILLLANNISGPVRELSTLSKKIADGDFSVRSYAPTRDPQVMELMETFNFMASRVQALFKELSQQKEQLDNIISVMKDGLLLLDHENRIVLANSSFEEIVQKKVEAGCFFWETAREHSLFTLIEDVRKTGANSVREVDIKGLIFLCSIISLEQKKQLLFIFHDITESKRLENIKKDFIANVSHELRTPLTAIRGFVETMESDEENAEKKHYLEVIRRHTDRLVNIVQDLLVLSQLEDNKQTLNISRIQVSDVLDNLALLFQPRIKEKGLSFTLKIDEDVPEIEADPFRLEQVFQNLLDNALKYTDTGSISINATNSEGNVLIQVSDTGIGIPEESLSRIFERFYVVDKSRSRQTGGTGLGLSIVKHILLLHKGRVEVESKPGQGTVFSVFLPIKQG